MAIGLSRGNCNHPQVVRHALLLLLGAIAYWLFLTVLLLLLNPAGLVGLSEIPMFPWGKFGIHLSAFIGLTILIHASRWPRRLCWPLFVFLLAYGLATESLQAFVPTRTVRLMDYTENILGCSLARPSIGWFSESCGRWTQCPTWPASWCDVRQKLTRPASETGQY